MHDAQTPIILNFLIEIRSSRRWRELLSIITFPVFFAECSRNLYWLTFKFRKRQYKTPTLTYYYIKYRTQHLLDAVCMERWKRQSKRSVCWSFKRFASALNANAIHKWFHLTLGDGDILACPLCPSTNMFSFRNHSNALSVMMSQKLWFMIVLFIKIIPFQPHAKTRIFDEHSILLQHSAVRYCLFPSFCIIVSCDITKIAHYVWYVCSIRFFAFRHLPFAHHQVSSEWHWRERLYTL